MDNIENYKDALRSVQNKEIEQRKTIKKLLQDIEELKKLLLIQRVSDRRELLIAFEKWQQEQFLIPEEADEVVDMYLKSN